MSSPKARFPKRRRRSFWALVLLVSAALVVWLYYSNRDTGFSNTVPAPIPEKQDQPDIYVGAGSAQFSIYAPQYPGSTVIEASRFEDGSGTTMIASMTTEDKVDEVADYYRNVLDEKGFEPSRASDGNGPTAQTTIAGGRASAGISVLVTIQSIPNNGTRIDLSDNVRTSNIP